MVKVDLTYVANSKTPTEDPNMEINSDFERFMLVIPLQELEFF
jgi:hypothetical protein